MHHKIWLLLCPVLLASCGRYRDFTLPPPAESAREVSWKWQAQPLPVLKPAAAWDASDVLNPSVVFSGGRYWNFYSGFDGKTWYTGLALSPDGMTWDSKGKVLSPDPATWEGSYIAANGSAIVVGNAFHYYYQAGTPPRIGLAESDDGMHWKKRDAPVLETGPYASWDERGVADPYVVRFGEKYYLFYLGMDRARRQRLGVAESADGVAWYKLRSNPVLETGSYGSFDENGLGEPAVWMSHGYYWMLFVGRARDEVRRMGLARSRDGVHWDRLPLRIEGDQPWDSKVICDPTVISDGDSVRVWFGGGDVARPDERIHGMIGAAMLRAN